MVELPALVASEVSLFAPVGEKPFVCSSVIEKQCEAPLKAPIVFATFSGESSLTVDNARKTTVRGARTRVPESSSVVNDPMILSNTSAVGDCFGQRIPLSTHPILVVRVSFLTSLL